MNIENCGKGICYYVIVVSKSQGKENAISMPNSIYKIPEKQLEKLPIQCIDRDLLKMKKQNQKGSSELTCIRVKTRPSQSPKSVQPSISSTLHLSNLCIFSR